MNILLATRPGEVAKGSTYPSHLIRVFVTVLSWQPIYRKVRPKQAETSGYSEACSSAKQFTKHYSRLTSGE